MTCFRGAELLSAPRSFAQTIVFNGQSHYPQDRLLAATGEITSKSYGRAAAAMTPLDASCRLIAAIGDTFAKDSADVLKRLAKLKPLRTKSDGDTLVRRFSLKRHSNVLLFAPEDDRRGKRRGDHNEQ
jgi:hypothetical protein